jgi:hypothetical protein
MFVSVTRLKLKNFFSLWTFFTKTSFAFRQVRRAEDNFFAETRGFGALTYCTLSGWESESAMRAYRDNGAYLKAMKVSRSITVLLQSAHFESPEKPSWNEALKRMEADPQSIKFGNPS